MPLIKGGVLPDDPGPYPSRLSPRILEQLDPRDVFIEHVNEAGAGTLDRRVAEHAGALAARHDDEALLELLGGHGLVDLVSVVCPTCRGPLMPPFWQGRAVVRCTGCDARYSVWVRGMGWDLWGPHPR